MEWLVAALIGLLVGCGVYRTARTPSGGVPVDVRPCQRQSAGKGRAAPAGSLACADPEGVSGQPVGQLRRGQMNVNPGGRLSLLELMTLLIAIRFMVSSGSRLRHDGAQAPQGRGQDRRCQARGSRLPCMTATTTMASSSIQQKTPNGNRWTTERRVRHGLPGKFRGPSQSDPAHQVLRRGNHPRVLGIVALTNRSPVRCRFVPPDGHGHRGSQPLANYPNVLWAIYFASVMF